MAVHVHLMWVRRRHRLEPVSRSLGRRGRMHHGVVRWGWHHALRRLNPLISLDCRCIIRDYGFFHRIPCTPEQSHDIIGMLKYFLERWRGHPVRAGRDGLTILYSQQEGHLYIDYTVGISKKDFRSGGGSAPATASASAPASSVRPVAGKSPRCRLLPVINDER